MRTATVGSIAHVASAPVPELAIVVLSYRNEATILAALDSLAPQIRGEDVELVVSHSGGGPTPALLAARRPDVRVLACEQRLLPGGARNAGVAATSAPYVAFLEGDCVALPGWVAGRLARHRAGEQAVGCAILPPDGRPVTLAAHLLLHATRLPHLDPPPAHRHGGSYARAAFTSARPFSETLRIGEDTAHDSGLRTAGVVLAWAPEVQTVPTYPTGVRELLADCARRGARRAAWREDGHGRIAIAALLLREVPRGLQLGLRRGSPLRRGDVLRAAPLLLASAIAAVGGVLTAPRGVVPSPPSAA